MKLNSLNLSVSLDFESQVMVVRHKLLNGQIYFFPRDRVDRVRCLLESSRAGVYCLFDDLEEGVIPRVYIGYSDDLKHRLQNHDCLNDVAYWSETAVITASSALTGSEAKFIEGELIRKAKDSKYQVQQNDSNSTIPKETQEDMEYFIDYLTSVFFMLGYNCFIPKKLMLIENTANSIRDTFRIDIGGHIATLVYEQGKPVVLAGSYAGYEKSTSVSHRDRRKGVRDRLIADGTLLKSDDYFIFQTDWYANSLSQASGIILGRESNGSLEWKNSVTGKSFKDWINRYDSSGFPPARE